MSDVPQTLPAPAGRGLDPGSPLAPHASSPADVLERLGSHGARGLGPRQVEEARARAGPNELQAPARDGRLQRLARQLRSLVVWVLIAAAAISLLLGEWIDALAIGAIVVLDALLGFFQEERAARALEALEQYAAPTARVLREGRCAVVLARELVPGDVVELESGDRVAADARLLSSVELRTQEAALTGESLPVEKRAEPRLAAPTPLAERANMVHMGTVVAAGRGRAVVTATGMRTELGRIAGLLQHAAPPPTPLQRRLEGLGRLLVAVCLLLVALIAALQLLRGGELLEVMMLAVSLAVAAIPEGLPAVVTVALALGLQRLVRRKALVRRLPSVETLGSVTVICSDKTGTLTRNEMTAREVRAGGRHYRVGGSGYEPSGTFRRVGAAGEIEVGPREEPDLAAALRTAALCNHAELVAPEEPGEPWRINGDPTEGALRTLARKGALDVALGSREHVLLELPFDSDRRAMTVVVRDAHGTCTAHTKGAPETVLPLCTHERVDAHDLPLDETRRAQLLEQNAELAARALRVLALARRSAVPEDAGAVERDLVLLGLVAMQDPPREGVREAVATCRRAGIRPMMITGDHPDTAVAIALELGLSSARDRAVTGAELDGWDDSELAVRVQTTAVFARVRAEHKLRIVRALQVRGHVVAMTGDGVNDAPALREADIGVAMGRSGTDVTRGAADMVLLDDDFATIVAAVEEGRCIFADVTKFVHYLLATNAAEVLAVLAAVVGGWAVPVLPVQILWINLVTDGLPALALGLEKPELDLMERPPRRPRAPVVSLGDGAWLLACGLLVAAAATTAFSVSLAAAADLPRARTQAFTVLVLSQLACAFVFRSRTRTALGLGLASNRPLTWAVALALVLQLLIVVWPPAHAVFGTVALGSREWGLAVLLALVPVSVLELTKLARAALRRRRGSS